MPTTTTTYSFNKPVVGADEDDWGGYLNGNWDSVDDLLDGTTPVTGIDINSGTLDGVTIGGTTAGAGTFTTLTSDGLTVQTVQGNIEIANSSAVIDMQRAGTNYIYASDASGNLRLGSGGSFNRMNIASNGDISFYEDTGTTAKFFWDASAESLGIGTSSPSTALHVSKGSSGGSANANAGIVIEDNSNTYLNLLSPNGFNNGVYFGDAADNDIGYINYAHGSDIMAFGVNAAERMRIDSSGNVIVKAGKELRVNRPDDATYGAISHGASGTGIVYNDLNGDGHHWQFAGSEKMRIDSSGNVGIGTTAITSPAGFSKTVLSLAGSTAPSVVLRQSTGNEMEWGLSASGGWFATADGYPLRFGTDNTERMRIDSSGNLLVGTTDNTPYNNSAGSTADNGIALGSTGIISSAKYNDATINLNRTGTDGDIAVFRKDGTTVGSIGVTGSGTQPYFVKASTGGFKIGNDGSTALLLPVNADGSNSDGGAQLGDATKRFKDLYLSGGVYLGGTGSANKLDDYEEGTFTPIISDAAGNTFTGSYAGRNGRYTKIGRLCQITFEMYVGESLTAGGLSGSEAVVIGALPFTNDGQNFSGGVVTNANGINYSGEQILLKGARSSTTLYIATLSSSTGSNEGNVTVTQFNNGTRLVYGTIIYEVA